MAEIYNTGTVSVAAGTTTVTGSAVLWSDVRPGDTIEIGDLPGRAVASLTDTSHLELAAPIGVDVVGSTYAIVGNAPSRFTSGYLAEQVRALVARAGILEATAPTYQAQAINTNTPPGSPVNGDMYVLGAAPTGAWVGRANNLAQWTGSAWMFTTPEAGWLAFAEGAGLFVFNGTIWEPGDLGIRPKGAWAIGTTYDVGDMVSHDGRAFVSLVGSNIGNSPPSSESNTTYWMWLPAGPQGEQGDAATIEVGDTTTVAYGTPASVTNVGTSGDAVFDFVIPAGPQGAPGVGSGGYGLPLGGTDGQALLKDGATDGAAVWADLPDNGVVTLAPGFGVDVDDTDPASPVVSVVSVRSYGAEPGGDASSLLAAFQAAIDDLPDNGGKIVVPEGDYTNLVPASLTVPLHKMVTWISHGATLPADMPGVRVTSGYQMQPYEGGSASSPRPGDAFMRLIVDGHVPDVTQVSQQDSILYLQGHIPAAEGSLAQEFTALRFNMHSEMEDPSVTPPTASNLDIKGIQGVVVGEAGNAKVRSIRTTSWGINGHTGLVTGAMVAASRGGTIPTESPWSGDGTATWDPDQAGPYLSGDAALLAQVGPGIQACMRMQGFVNPARPAYGLLQELGAAALLPEQAAIFLHGGGNGDMIRGAVSHLDGTPIFNVTKQGRVRAKGFYSESLSIADDAVATITPASTSGFIAVYAAGTAGNWWIGYYRAAGTAVATAIASGAQGAAVTSSLSGTTGADGNLTVAALSGGTIQIENRTGASRTVTVTFLAS
jgi:hypothetical protein